VGDYRGLRAYQLALELAVEVHARTRQWPSYERWSIGGQLVRAAGSIGANIAEAEGRWHAKDRMRFLVMARGSLFETRHWINLAARTGLVVEGSYGAQLDELGRTTNGLIRRAAGLIANS
jgi:four helix bundle protein